MRIFAITAFPEIFKGPLEESIIKRAREKRIVDIQTIDLRDFAADKHRQIDDYPYGGGPGMILKPEPLFQAVDFLTTEYGLTGPEIILMTPQGVPYSQNRAKELSEKKELIFLCGHYKGVDERVRQHLVTTEISIGDYIVTGGELPAMVVIDSIVRLLPDVLGDQDSAKSDSFENGLLDCAYYTRPENFRGMHVPEVLLSGHHAEIERWRQEQAQQRTKNRRKDLFENC
jgi:tRNA (guanine37-N1)-methyltransferase